MRCPAASFSSPALTLRAGKSPRIRFESPARDQECFDISAKPKLSESLAPVETLSFEAALKELEDIVSKLEQGEVDLEDSIALYERGQGLKAHCEKKLKAAEGRLEKVVQGASGATSEPLDIG